MPQRSSAPVEDEYGLEKAPSGGGVTDSEYGLESAGSSGTSEETSPVGTFQTKKGGPVRRARDFAEKGEEPAPEHTLTGTAREGILGLSSGFTGMPETEHPIKDWWSNLKAQTEQEQKEPWSFKKVAKMAFAPQISGAQAIKGIGEGVGEMGTGAYHLNPEEFAHGAGSTLGQAAQLGLIPEIGAEEGAISGAVRRGAGKVLPSKETIGLKVRQPDNALKPGVEATARAMGAGTGALAHLAGVPLIGELAGYALGPKFAEAILPNYPERVPVKPGQSFAPLPSIEDFYANRGEELTARGKEQAKLDKAHAERLEEAETARQKELADAEKLKEQHAQAIVRRGKEQAAIDKASAVEPSPFAGMASTAPGTPGTIPSIADIAPQKPVVIPKMEIPGVTAPTGPKEKPVAPKIISPTEGEAARAGNEGRAATWTNERVLEFAAKGNRDAIQQAILRNLELPPNARYVMGDPDVSRAVLNPRETTRFTPEGEPIRNKENPFTQEPTAKIPTLSRTPRTPGKPIPALSPVTRPSPLPFPGPMPEAAPLPAAAAVGERPQAPTAPQASAAPTLLEPIPPMGIKPLQGVKPIIEGAPEPQNVPRETISKGGKVGPPSKRFTREEIQAAEGLLDSESGAMLSADRPDVYFDERDYGDVFLASREGKGARRGGSWRGVKSGRNMHPFMRENPEVNPAEVQKALRNKDSAAYNKLVTRAAEFLKRQTEGTPEGGLPEAMDFIRSLREGREAEPAAPAAAPPQSPVIPNIGETGVIPGMEQAVKEQSAGAAKVAGEKLTEEANRPKDISQAAGKMETLSPLFRGTEASPQREIFGGKAPAAPPVSQVPPAIEPILKETGWEFTGKTPLGQYEIREPGTNVKLVLFERELQPDFIRRKIAEKEKQYGVPAQKEPKEWVGQVTYLDQFGKKRTGETKTFPSKESAEQWGSLQSLKKNEEFTVSPSKTKKAKPKGGGGEEVPF